MGAAKWEENHRATRNTDRRNTRRNMGRRMGVDDHVGEKFSNTRIRVRKRFKSTMVRHFLSWKKSITRSLPRNSLRCHAGIAHCKCLPSRWIPRSQVQKVDQTCEPSTRWRNLQRQNGCANLWTNVFLTHKTDQNNAVGMLSNSSIGYRPNWRYICFWILGFRAQTFFARAFDSREEAYKHFRTMQPKRTSFMSMYCTFMNFEFRHILSTITKFCWNVGDVGGGMGIFAWVTNSNPYIVEFCVWVQNIFRNIF